MGEWKISSPPSRGHSSGADDWSAVILETCCSSGAEEQNYRFLQTYRSSGAKERNLVAK